jgi:hypothetical protein
MTEQEATRPTTCPTCGNVYDPSRKTYCDKCGNRFPWAGPEPASKAKPTDSGDVARILVAAGTALFFGFAGFQMVTLRSVSGDTVAEAFYYMGWFSFGMALFAILVALPRRAPSSSSGV